jgi:hypothetical protein
MVELIYAMLVPGLILQPAQAHQDPVALRVRVYADNHVDPGIIPPALEVAGDLLSAAGIVVSWRICETPEACPPDEFPEPETIVIFSSKARRNASDNCGVAALGARETVGTVIVSVPCLASFAFRLTRGIETRTNPLVAVLNHVDLAGAVVAHEIAHLLGIRHASTGLMRATMEAGDVVALRSRRLRFSPTEAGRMRIAALSASAGQPRATSARR